jgi:microcystin-dependent protein
MAEPFIGEIRLMSIVYAPRDWALCNGQLLPIAQNQALFSLLGTTYGGNGQTTFALPDFRGRVPIHVGNGHTLGERAGEQAHTVTVAEMPTHVHSANSSTAVATSASPTTTSVLAQSIGANLYGAASSNQVAMNPGMITNVGGSQAHQNMQPYLTISFCIALTGIFPSPN